MRISREGVEQIEIRFDFQKAERLHVRGYLGQISDISTPSPLKSRPKIGSESGPKRHIAIFLKFGSKDFSGFHHAVRG